MVAIKKESVGGTKIDRPSTIKVWIEATRPHTLTASLCPCLVSYGYCSNKELPIHMFVAWVIFCLTIQIGTNLHNDYADYIHGADSDDKRVGQPRATAKGWLTVQQTCIACTGTLLITFSSGLYLIYITEQYNNTFIWFLIISSIFNAFAYTGGPYPLGYLFGIYNWSIAYSGLGDIFVFIYFGLVATWMMPYLLLLTTTTFEWTTQILIYGIQVGLLATNIIVVNNLRDRHSDVTVGKRTTAVRFGRTFSSIEYILCNVISYILVVVNASTTMMKTNSSNNSTSIGTFAICCLPLLSTPLAIKETKAMLHKEGAALNPHVGGAAKVQLAFCLLLTTSCLLLG